MRLLVKPEAVTEVQLTDPAREREVTHCGAVPDEVSTRFAVPMGREMSVVVVFA
jgi:hypothetical protein